MMESTKGRTPPDEPAAVHMPAWLTGDLSLAVPMLPDVAQRVIAMTSDPDISIIRLSEMVAKDQVLASRVLGLANSAYSAPAAHIGTVSDSIVRLGTSSVRNLVVAVSLTSRMQDQAVYGARGRQLFDHALGTAYMARLVAERVGVNEDEAFLCGLIHDIGKLVILKVAHEHSRAHAGVPGAEEIERVIAERHASIGGLALRRWKLPETVDEPVIFHHRYADAPTYTREAAVCYLANRLSHRYGFGCAKDSANLGDDDVCAMLGLDTAWLAAMDERAPGLVAVANQMLR
jgi:putative nucleotidyltransferase with HDIG domain